MSQVTCEPCRRALSQNSNAPPRHNFITGVIKGCLGKEIALGKKHLQLIVSEANWPIDWLVRKKWALSSKVHAAHSIAGSILRMSAGKCDFSPGVLHVIASRIHSKRNKYTKTLWWETKIMTCCELSLPTAFFEVCFPARFERATTPWMRCASAKPRQGSGTSWHRPTIASTQRWYDLRPRQRKMLPCKSALEIWEKHLKHLKPLDVYWCNFNQFHIWEGKWWRDFCYCQMFTHLDGNQLCVFTILWISEV